jgi:serine/threonine protein kinase
MDKSAKSDENQKITKGNFKQITEVGAGTYGKVYKMKSVDNENLILAFKKITYSKDNEGFPQTALREIKILQTLSHKNIIKLHNIIMSKPSENNKYRGSTFLVFDYMEHDLYGLIKIGHKFTTPQVKSIMKQLLEGVLYIHQKDIIHRDLKCANILVNSKGDLKIADFGLARNLNSLSGQYTTCVVTLWYRAPELLLGDKKYTTQIDMWSVGCIMAELILGRPIFPGDKELKQCELIFKTCGSPDEFNWPEAKGFPHYNTFAPNEFYPRCIKPYMKKHNPELDDLTLDLLDRLLSLNPDKRLKAKDALEHEYFKSEAIPTDLSGVLPSQECHYTLLKNREKERHAAQESEGGYPNNLGKRKYNDFESKPRPPGYYASQQQQQQQQVAGSAPPIYYAPPPLKPIPPPERPLPPPIENRGDRHSASYYANSYRSNPPPPKGRSNDGDGDDLEAYSNLNPNNDQDSHASGSLTYQGLGSLISSARKGDSNKKEDYTWNTNSLLGLDDNSSKNRYLDDSGDKIYKKIHTNPN